MAARPGFLPERGEPTNSSDWISFCRTLKAIGRECQQLKCLDVSMCSGITMMDVEYFKSCLPLQTSIVSRFVGGADLSLTL